MLAFLNQVRKPTLDLPLDVRRKMWFKPFMQSYLVVFIGYLTMYLIRKNFNIAQNDMISTYGLSMTQLGMIGLGFSITYGVGKTLVSYYADGKNTKQFLPFMLILSAICMLGFSASMGAGSTSLFLMIAFYALSGFFQSTGGSCSYSTITKWTPRRKRGTFLGSGISLTTSAARARRAWRCSARTICSTATSSACSSSRRLLR
jgi:OPA family hexose phosphate transport protein UhpT-like MFS transporter